MVVFDQEVMVVMVMIAMVITVVVMIVIIMIALTKLVVYDSNSAHGDGCDCNGYYGGSYIDIVMMVLMCVTRMVQQG